MTDLQTMPRETVLSAMPGGRKGWLFAAAVAIGWGLLAGWWTPRGPLTTGEALWSIAISVLVGGAAGLASRSRWAMLGAPLLFASAFELMRVGTDGPTVDGIHTSLYGWLAFGVGRGFHALVSTLPILWGAAIGAGVARRVTSRLGGRRWARYARRTVAVVAGAGLLAFTVVLARPPSTAPITSTNGAPADSVAELVDIDVNGGALGMMIRGHSSNNPVVLFLAGGPGGSERGAMRNHLAALEERFSVATWDQRSSGTSYPALDPTSTYTLNAAVADTIATTDYLRERFGKEKLYLLGQSWGTILGILAVQQRPDLYTAFIGTGQMGSPLETDRIFYADTLAWARQSNNAALADRLTTIGAPPYQNMLDYETALAQEHEVYPYDHSGNSEGEGGFSENFLVPEYALIDQVHLLGAFMDTFSVIYPQIQGVDLRIDATTLEVPVYFAQGAHEARGRSVPFQQWYAALSAPHKELAVLDSSGHRPLFEQPELFVGFMTGTVLAQTT